jgi:putative DNA primase/helicase
VASNIGPDGGGFEYDVEQTLLPAPLDFTTQHVVWGIELQGEARALLSELEENPKPAKIDRASHWLLTRLAAGPVDRGRAGGRRAGRGDLLGHHQAGQIR